MVASSFFWRLIKGSAVGGVVGLAISDRYARIITVRGDSMHPTFAEASSDLAIAERLCLRRYEFSHGDVVLFSSPSNHKRHAVKRIIGLPGDWIQVPDKAEILQVPEGHCWVEGDNSDISLDSRSYGAIPLGLVQGRVTHVIWPPHRIGQVKRKVPEGRVSSHVAFNSSYH